MLLSACRVFAKRACRHPYHVWVRSDTSRPTCSVSAYETYHGATYPEQAMKKHGKALKLRGMIVTDTSYAIAKKHQTKHGSSMPHKVPRSPLLQKHVPYHVSCRSQQLKESASEGGNNSARPTSMTTAYSEQRPMPRTRGVGRDTKSGVWLKIWSRKNLTKMVAGWQLRQLQAA